MGYFASAFAICIAIAPIALVGLLTKDRAHSPLITTAALCASIVAGIVQLGWWIEWSALCLILGKSWELSAAPSWKWLYLVIAFFESVSIVGMLASQENQAKRSSEDSKNDNAWIGMGLYWLSCAVAFLVFVFRPAWALQILPPFLRFKI